MRRSYKNVIAALTIVPATALAADSSQIAQGRWEETFTVSAVSLDGNPFPLEAFKDDNQARFACVTSAGASDLGRFFMDASDGKDCGAPEGSAGGGKVALVGQCVMNDGAKMTLAVDGDYSHDSYSASARADTLLDGRKLRMEAKVAGRFVGACQGDEGEWQGSARQN